MAELGVEYVCIDVYAIQVGGLVIDPTEEPTSQLTQERVQPQSATGTATSTMEEERCDYNENLSQVRVEGPTMEGGKWESNDNGGPVKVSEAKRDGVTASSSSEEGDEGDGEDSEDSEGVEGEGTGEGDEGKGYMDFDEVKMNSKAKVEFKGQGKGILLTAIGLDPNDQIFPIAFAVVAVESTETWTWFLNFLVIDLEIKDSSKWTFISDRQKGLINAVRSCCHMAEHRFCVWHMHNNFRKVFSSTTLKDMIWEAARATNEYAFNKVMDDMKKLNPAAYKWLTTHTSKEHWSRAFFGFEAKCDILVNNISECYNRVLLFARDKPLYGMLECIRMYLMDRFTNRRKMAQRLEDCVGPKIRKKLEKLKDKVRHCMVREAGEWQYEVNTTFNEQFVVNLRDRTCSCRRWMLTGLPCPHACAAIQLSSETVESFIPTWYSMETFRQVYAGVIYPVHGPDMWPKTAHANIVPPDLKRLPGRPRGSRIKSVEEQAERRKAKAKLARVARRLVDFREEDDGGKKMTRRGLMADYKCRTCGEKGHNKRRCPQGRQASTEPKEPRVRKKRNRAEEQPKCSLCHQPGHNKSRCQSKVANMYAEAEKDVAASSSNPLKKKKAGSSSVPPKKKKAEKDVAA